MAHAGRVLLTMILVVSGAAVAAVPDDTTFEQRRNAVLPLLAQQYKRENPFTNCVRYGFATHYMAAKLEAFDRGLAGGISPSAAAADINHLADSALTLFGTGTQRGPCSWENSGSPAGLHAALGLGLIAHQWGTKLPATTRTKLRNALHANYRSSISPLLVNGNISVVAGWLLGGEALGDATLWNKGMSALTGMYNNASYAGAIELNSPVYTHYQLAALTPLTLLKDPTARNMGRILTDFVLLMQAHLYLPGGGLGAPQSRDYAGGAADANPSGLHHMLWFLAGDPLFKPATNVHLAGPAIAGYKMPTAIRSIFLDKGKGYTYWAYSHEVAGAARFPNAIYPFGLNNQSVSPWQAVVTPDAMMGLAYGFRYQSIHVSMGVYARGTNGRTPILYHYQPLVEGDTSDIGSGFPSTGGDTNPDDFTRELYDYERMVHGRTMISLWDPTLANKPSGVVRTHQDTRARVPNYAAYGGAQRVDGRWRVGQIGKTYIAYYPLGTIASTGSRDGGTWQYYRLSGRSGCIVELATTDQFPTIDAYLADLKSRQVTFSTSPLRATFQALDPVTGAKVPITLEHRPERRIVNGQAISTAAALDHGLMSSPFVQWTRSTQRMELKRDCYDRVTYDWKQKTVTTTPAPTTCGMPPPAQEIFSAVPYLGDIRNWSPQTPSRWQVETQENDLRLALKPFTYVANGGRLGEYALVKDRTYTDFSLTLKAKTSENLATRSNADYAVVFGWQDPDNYYFLLANATAAYSELFALENGVRRSLGVATASLLPDAGWHTLQLTRRGAQIGVMLDGALLLSAQDATFGEGAVGVGSLNDSAWFDDVEITTPDPNLNTDPPEEVEPPAEDPTEDDGATDETDVPADQSPADQAHTQDDTFTAGGCGCAAGAGGGAALWLLCLLGVALTRSRAGSAR